jgi:hypothetical protein
MSREELNEQLIAIQKRIVATESLYNEASGLYIDAYAYKIKYLQALYDAVLQEMRLTYDY